MTEEMVEEFGVAFYAGTRIAGSTLMGVAKALCVVTVPLLAVGFVSWFSVTMVSAFRRSI